MAAFVILYIKGNVLAGPGRAGPRVGIYTGRARPGLVLAAVNGPGRAGPCGARAGPAKLGPCSPLMTTNHSYFQWLLRH